MHVAKIMQAERNETCFKLLRRGLSHAKIRKEINKTMKRNINNYILAAFAVVLAALCVRSIYMPIGFEREKEARETSVKMRLMSIKKAEEAYLKAHGTYCNSLETLVKERLITDSLTIIPHSEGLTFHIVTATVTTPSGKEVPVMECGTTYDEYLKGMNPDGISALIEKAGETGRYPGLKIGDLEKNNENAGNWEQTSY